ncbi:DUF7133 domain-containing protein [Pararhodonellum marinum]|uniref:DUF7133 domain-containing protein n=1 Tax=Pararhodonellum marinum TaxID=2755358 RepID=UPI001E480A1C|nr:PQQ-dependent sugar dehydrogenase [Pararhodonellum marinum]
MNFLAYNNMQGCWVKNEWPKRWVIHLAWLIPLLLCCCSTKNSEENLFYSQKEFPVYGHYRLEMLPIDKGVSIVNPIQISLGPNGHIYAANQTGEIYRLLDSDGDGLEDEAALYVDVSEFGLRSPSGFTYRGDTVYIGTSQEIRAFVDMDGDGRADSSWTFFNEIPFSNHPYEWTTGLNFGPDGWLYCAMSTDSWNAGASPDPKGYRGAIIRISPDGKQSEILASGIRSVYGVGFNQEGDLFFTDNEGGGNPHEELNLLVAGAFYGHNPLKYGSPGKLQEPAHILKTEVAPGGMAFNSTENDFGDAAGQLFIAFYGPGERWQRGGVGRVKIEKQDDSNYVFEEFPVADIPKLSDLAFGKNGDLYLAQHGRSDYWYNPTETQTGGFFRLIYDPEVSPTPVAQRELKPSDLSENAIEAGKQLFAERACSACHQVDESEELLGPNLNDIGNRLSRAEIREEIEAPSEIIKPSMMGVKITLNDGKVQLGRIINTDEKHLSVMLVGNFVEKIPRDQIIKVEEEKKSLMYEGLLSGLSEQEIEHLLDYIISLSRSE